MRRRMLHDDAILFERPVTLRKKKNIITLNYSESFTVRLCTFLISINDEIKGHFLSNKLHNT